MSKMLSEKELADALGCLADVPLRAVKEAAKLRITDHIDAQAEQLKKANDTLVRLHDYGIDTRDFGDGDAQALWERVDEFRGLDRDDANATLSPDDVRELAEWWAELHTIMCDLDEKYVAAEEAREKAVAKNAGYKSHLDNALRQAKESCPDYPWSPSPTMSEIAWAVCTSLEGTSLACDDWEAKAKRFKSERDAQAERIAALEKVVEAYKLLCVTYRLSDTARADRALTRLERAKAALAALDQKGE